VEAGKLKEVARQDLPMPPSEGAGHAEQFSESLAQFGSAAATHVQDSQLTVVLNPSFCPGMVIDLGAEPMPRAVRLAFAKSRLLAVTDQSDQAWDVRLDSSYVCGPVFAFAIKQRHLSAIESLTKTHGARLESVKPLLSWAWQAHAEKRFTGLFVTQLAGDVGFVISKDGRPLSLELRRVVLDDLDWEAESNRQALLTGSDFALGDIRIFVAPGEARPRLAPLGSTKVQWVEPAGIV
jgi:hypothetical protein